MRTWASGRARTRGTVQPANTPYGCVVPAYADSAVIRHVVVGDDAVRHIAATGDRPLGLSIVGDYDQWEGALPADLKSFGEPMSLMVGPLDTARRDTPAGYDLSVEQTDCVCTARAFSGGEVVSQVHGGMASGSPAGHQDVVVFDQVSTSPEHRRRGLGALLMSVVNEWARSRGAESALLSASPEGVLLYTALGYDEIAPMAAWESDAPSLPREDAVALHERRLAALTGPPTT